MYVALVRSSKCPLPFRALLDCCCSGVFLLTTLYWQVMAVGRVHSRQSNVQTNARRIKHSRGSRSPHGRSGQGRSNHCQATMMRAAPLFVCSLVCLLPRPLAHSLLVRLLRRQFRTQEGMKNVELPIEVELETTLENDKMDPSNIPIPTETEQKISHPDRHVNHHQQHPTQQNTTDHGNDG